MQLEPAVVLVAAAAVRTRPHKGMAVQAALPAVEAAVVVPCSTALV
jgi:hypothetical protein